MAEETAAEYAARQVAEWSKYVATETIFIGGVRAINEGDAVPASHVDRKDAPVGKHQVRLVTPATTTEKG